ncbi:MAG TPA: hypothetical protein VG055_12735 [Planctomycetaceae bacterium]|jgi:hypothetical protein|nr:hypothetical protein [Planctomycetaceae bacterium]
MTLKESIENNPVVVYLGIACAGFVAGIGAYDVILRVSQSKVVPAPSVILQPEEVAIASSKLNSLQAAEAELEQLKKEKVPVEEIAAFYKTFLAYELFGNDPKTPVDARAKHKQELVDLLAKYYKHPGKALGYVLKGNDYRTGTVTIKLDPTNWTIPTEINEAVHQVGNAATRSH